MRNRVRLVRAFTMIEIIVVTAIVAALMALLLPVFVSARAAAQESACVSNLKNMSTAYTLYATDYDDTFCPPVLFSNLALYPLDGWYGALKSATEPVDLRSGLLYPYIEDTGIFDCPSIAVITDLSSQDRSYGLNDQLCITTVNLRTFDPTFHTVNSSDVEIPAETIMFGDCAENVAGPQVTRRAIIQFNSEFSNGVSRGFLHSRHVGRVATVSWIDGHVKAMPLSYNTRKDGAYSAEWEQANGLGDLLKFPRQYAGPTGTKPSVQDMYYYLVNKSVDPSAGLDTLTNWLVL